MTLRDAGGLVLLVLAALAIATLLQGCFWAGQTKPVVGLYVPSLQPISRDALSCLSQEAYHDLVQRELEWRYAFEQCRATVEELTVQP